MRPESVLTDWPVLVDGLRQMVDRHFRICLIQAGIAAQRIRLGEAHAVRRVDDLLCQLHIRNCVPQQIAATGEAALGTATPCPSAQCGSALLE